MNKIKMTVAAAVAMAGIGCRTVENVCGAASVCDDERQFTYDDKLATILHPLVKEPVRFTVIADTHFTWHDERDEAMKDNLARIAQWPGREADLDAAFAAARKFGADIVPLAGDMFSFPSYANVEFLDRKMRASGLDCRYVSGNHDWHFEGLPGSDDELRATWIRRRMACLYRGEDPMAYSVVKKGVRFVFVDGTTYRITPAQLAFFKKELATGDPVVLVMHVPFWMAPHGATDTLANPHWGYDTDVNYVPERRERWPKEGQPRESFEFAELAFSAPNMVAVFAGHEHVLQVASRRGVPQFIVPANCKSGAYMNVRLSNGRDGAKQNE